jgi:hypothetical protein
MLSLGTVKAMLVDAAFTPNQDTFDFINDVTSEAAGTGYTAGGITLTGVVVNLDAATNKVTLDADNIDDPGISVLARWMPLYVSTGTPSTSPVLCYFDLSQGLGGNVTFTGFDFDAAGILPLQVA